MIAKHVSGVAIGHGSVHSNGHQLHKATIGIVQVTLPTESAVNEASRIKSKNYS